MKPHQEALIVLLLITILSATCGFVAYHISAAADNSKIEMIFKFHAITEQLKNNSSAIHEIQNSLESLKQEFQQITFTPSKQHISKTSHFKATLIQANLEEQEPILLIPTPAPEQKEQAFNPFQRLKTPDEYWQKLQKAASTRESLKHNPKEKQKFLKNGADLIQRYEEARASFFIDSDVIPSIEAKADTDPLKAIESMGKIKKDLMGYISEAKQYCRELDAMLDEPAKIRLPSRTSYLPVATGNTTQQAYSHLRLDPLIEIVQDGNMLARIHFFYNTERGGIPYLAQVSDVINLRNMSSTSGEYVYADYFQREIQEYIHRQWRFQNLKWNKQPTDRELQQFLIYIGK
jgi:hypothetical protein